MKAGQLRLGLVTLVLGVSVICGWDYLLGEQAIGATPVSEVSASSIAERVRKARGHALILSLYRAGSDDPYTVADVRRWTIQSRGPEVVAVAVGSRRDAQLLFRYGEEHGIQRLPPNGSVRLRPERWTLCWAGWESGVERCR
jgi:hypothetical protein